MRLLMGLLSLASAVSISTAPVRETDSQVLYLNLPLPVETVQAWLNPALAVDPFDARAWVTLMAVHVDKIEMKLPLVGFVPTGSSGWLLKAQTYVTRPATGDVGYVILSMDFASLLQAAGCAATQPGVQVHTATLERTDTTQTVTASDGVGLLAEFTVSEGQQAPEELLAYMIARPWKFEQDGPGGAVVGAKQDGRDDPALLEGDVVEVSAFESELLKQRFGWKDAGAPANCFLSSSLVFVDYAVEPVAAVAQAPVEE